MALPVDPERLRRQFPSLDDADLAAYAEVTTRILASPSNRGKVLAEVLSAAERAQAKETAGAGVEPEEKTALAYVRALAKIQGRPVPPPA